MSERSKIVFLHGLGETRDVWDSVIEQLPQTECIAQDVLKTYPSGARWSLEDVCAQIADSLTEPVHLAGLSLGAVIALNIAITYPDKVSSLFISAPQVKLPKKLMNLQKLLIRVLPAKWVCPPRLSKSELLGVLNSLQDLDLTSSLQDLSMPVTVVCGSKDRPNLLAARKIASLIPTAHLEVIQGVGHQWHSTHPKLFARHLTAHLAH